MRNLIQYCKMNCRKLAFNFRLTYKLHISLSKFEPMTEQTAAGLDAQTSEQELDLHPSHLP